MICGICGKKKNSVVIEICKDCLDDLTEFPTTEAQKKEVYLMFEDLLIRLGMLGSKLWKKYDPVPDMRMITKLRERIIGNYTFRRDEPEFDFVKREK